MKYKHKQTEWIADNSNNTEYNIFRNDKSYWGSLAPCLVENTNDWELIPEPKEEIIEGICSRIMANETEYVLTPVISIYNPTPETKALLKGKRYERYVSGGMLSDLQKGTEELEGRYFQIKKYDIYSHKIIIITEAENELH